MMSSETVAVDRSAETARARAAVYHLLARLWGREVDEPLLGALRDGPLAEACEAVGIRLDDKLARSPTEHALEALAVEYARLFIGPGSHISANESMFAPLDGEEPRLWGSAATSVRRFIRNTGLSYSSEYTGMPDSIDVELELVGTLAGEEARLCDEDDESAAHQAFDLQRRFLDDHLLRWVGMLCERVEGDAQLDLYASVARATRTFVVGDAEDIARRSGPESADRRGRAAD